MLQTVELHAMLDARERRAQQQEFLRKKYEAAIICFTMNIAGPVKNGGLIHRAFHIGNTLLHQQLAAAKLPILFFEESNDVTGNESFYVVDTAPLRLKQITTELEDNTPLGRLFDMDVLDKAGVKLDRALLALPERHCLCCGTPGKDCARNRTHTVQKLQAKTKAVLSAGVMDWDARQIATQACRALLFEVCTTPKPGLVDRDNSGSHKDMDIFTFMSSASALWPYFEECAQIGLANAALSAPETLAALRPAGRRAEGMMLGATAGVNTHKGAIFSVGILCAALGRLSPEQRRCPDIVLQEAGAMAVGLTTQEYKNVTLENAATAGQRFYVLYGITGVRGQVEEGFPAVSKVGLPVLEQGLRNGKTLNDAGCAALLALIAADIDTNLIARSDFATQQRVANHLGKLLEKQPCPDRKTLETLNEAYTGLNLSPGGSADLLAVCYLLHFMEESV